MSCGVGHKHSLDLALLWLWCKPTVTAPIRPLAWEPPHTSGVALKRQKKKRKNPFPPIQKYSLDATHISFPSFLKLYFIYNVVPIFCSTTKGLSHTYIYVYIIYIYIFSFFCLFRAAPTAYGSS